MKVFLPYRGEFGFVIMMHSPQVYAELSGYDGNSVVFCELGNEALYPGASEYREVPYLHTDMRREAVDLKLVQQIRNNFMWSGTELVKKAIFIPPDPRAEKKYFIPKPHVPVGDIIGCDVVVCPRKRGYGPDKNWRHWQPLVNELQSLGLQVFAAGAPDSSFDVKTNSGRAWDYSRFLDASIAAMLSSKFVISTDNGLAHLAVVCGRPLAMISCRNGLVAEGTDDKGRPYWPIQIKRFTKENHTGSPIEILLDTWGSAKAVVSGLRTLRWI